MSLSDKIEESPTYGSGEFETMIYAKDVKEFIKQLKEKLHCNGEKENATGNIIEGIINKLAGEELI